MGIHVMMMMMMMMSDVNDIENEYMLLQIPTSGAACHGVEVDLHRDATTYPYKNVCMYVCMYVWMYVYMEDLRIQQNFFSKLPFLFSDV